MYYQVYGIYNESGTNYEAGTARSYAQALSIARAIVACPKYAIVERKAANYIALSATIGDRGKMPYRKLLLVKPTANARFIKNDKVGRKFWKDEF